MIAIKYRSIVQRGANKNDYYEQSEQDRKQLVDHINTLVYLNIYRTDDFADERDWKLFNEEMIKPVKWAKGSHKWKPSVRDMLAQCIATGANSYNGTPARFSVKQIQNYNKCCDIIAAVWNKTASTKIGGDELKVDMQRDETNKDPLGHVAKFRQKEKT